MCASPVGKPRTTSVMNGLVLNLITFLNYCKGDKMLITISIVCGLGIALALYEAFFNG